MLVSTTPFVKGDGNITFVKVVPPPWKRPKRSGGWPVQMEITWHIRPTGSFQIWKVRSRDPGWVLSLLTLFTAALGGWVRVGNALMEGWIIEFPFMAVPKKEILIDYISNLVALFFYKKSGWTGSGNWLILWVILI